MKLVRSMAALSDRPTSISALVNLVVLGLGLATSIMLTRWLLPTGRGEVAAVLLWPMLLTYAANLGLIDAITFYTAAGKFEEETILGTSLLSVVAQVAVFGSIGYMILPFVMPQQSPSVVWLSKVYLLYMPVSLATLYLMSILQGRLLMIRYNAVRLVIPIGYFIVTILLQTSDRLTVQSVIATNMALNVAALTVAVALIRPGISFSKIKFDCSLAREMLTFGLKTHVGGLTSQLNVRLDQVVLAALLDPAQLGLYVAAVSASNPLQIVPSAVRMVATPAIAASRTVSDQAQHITKVMGTYWSSTLLVYPPLAISLPVLIPLVYGEEFRTAILAAQILLVGAVFQGGKLILGGVSQALNRPWVSSKAELVGLLGSGVGVVVLVPILGINGAAIAIALSSLLVLIFLIHGIGTLTGISTDNLVRPNTSQIKSAFSRRED